MSPQTVTSIAQWYLYSTTYKRSAYADLLHIILHIILHIYHCAVDVTICEDSPNHIMASSHKGCTCRMTAYEMNDTSQSAPEAGP